MRSRFKKLALCAQLAMALVLSMPERSRADASSKEPAPENPLRATIERHLGRPYNWGATGLKSYDCSGFIWRVMRDQGLLIKRTTARKLYRCLPKVKENERWEFGNIVFFDDLKHCGIVDSKETFYHAATHRGTNRSKFDPLWRRKIYGVRAMPRSATRDTTP